MTEAEREALRVTLDTLRRMAMNPFAFIDAAELNQAWRDLVSEAIQCPAHRPRHDAIGFIADLENVEAKLRAERDQARKEFADLQRNVQVTTEQTAQMFAETKVLMESICKLVDQAISGQKSPQAVLSHIDTMLLDAMR